MDKSRRAWRDARKGADAFPDRMRRRLPTKLQLALLEYILHYVDRWGLQPDQTQMSRHFGSVRKSWARQHIHSLVVKGFLGLPEPGFHGLKIFRRPDGSTYYRGARPFGGPRDRPRPVPLSPPGEPGDDA